jgi:hypothetical protein
MLTEFSVTTVVFVFETVINKGVEATPTVAEGNVSTAGATDRLDEGGGVPPPPPATPVPVKEIVSGELAALLEIDRDALRVPAAEGVNTACTAHDPPAASVAGQPAATLKSLAAAPEKLAPLRVIAAAPVFLTVTVRGAEATPTVVEGNASAPEDKDNPDVGDRPSVKLAGIPSNVGW